MSLQEAAVAMYVASVDYDDNKGSSSRDEFWEKFEEARRNYLAIKKNTYD